MRRTRRRRLISLRRQSRPKRMPLRKWLIMLLRTKVQVVVVVALALIHKGSKTVFKSSQKLYRQLPKKVCYHVWCSVSLRSTQRTFHVRLMNPLISLTVPKKG
jgi:hypothetical protein